MREILFRGKKTSTKEWIEGSLIINKSGNHVITQVIENPVHLGTLNGWCFAVIPETIGQYTGLKDKNGTNIFENDILQWVSCNPFSKGEIRKGQVYFIEAHFWCKGTIGVYLGELLVHEKCEVIGNIHDNPELLKGE